MSQHPIRVFLCDDVPAFRSLMRYVLEEDPGIRVVGEAGDGQAGVDGVAEEKPDVVLLDLSMPILDGLETIPLMLDVSPGTKIIGLSGFTADRMAETMIAQGALAYFEKGADLEDITQMVRELGTPAP
ncbi:MAG: response regulator transcription factor [Solirubrobacterales bacterium]|jgi:DNA-binding NarL/FixJ family response regulator|nr:response regulator transcription factor [Solirubrobacterales bacterium]